MKSPIETIEQIQADVQRRSRIVLLVFVVLFVTLLIIIANTKGFESPYVSPKATVKQWL